jgi:hypothetical protein
VHPIIGEFVIDESFTLEVLELLHPHEIRMNLPKGAAGGEFRYGY